MAAKIPQGATYRECSISEEVCTLVVGRPDGEKATIVVGVSPWWCGHSAAESGGRTGVDERVVLFLIGFDFKWSCRTASPSPSRARAGH